VIEERKRIAEEVCVISGRLAQRGWCPATSGNISARLPGTSRVLTKITGRSMCGLGTCDLVEIDLDGNQLDGEGPPTKEWRFHAGIYRCRPEVNAVVHVHSPAATGFAVAGVELPLVTAPAKAQFERIPTLPSAAPGSPELARSVTDAFEDMSTKAVLLGGHGVVVVGKTLFDAWCLAELVEDNAKVAVLADWLEARRVKKG
jgi:ribulose-5-phosphate 4-epimerase/fuculose-1-phosphate aldolase